MSRPLDLTKPVQTRDGRPARVICTDRKHQIGRPLLALVDQLGDGNEIVVGYMADGMNGDVAGPLNLVNVPAKREGWVNIENRRSGLHSEIYASEYEANEAAAVNRVACVRIEWEEPV